MNNVTGQRHWFQELFKPQRVGDFKGSFLRSLWLAGIVMLLTVSISLAAGLAFRKGFKGDSAVFYLTISSLIVPSILLTLGIGLEFDQMGLESHWYSSGLGAHLSWTLPFGVIMAVPFALLVALLAIVLRGIPNDVYFQIGLLTLIALERKLSRSAEMMARSGTK